MKVLLAGGGTAGHINPALAIASIIKEHRPDAEFLYAGTPNGMEARLVPRENINFAPIRVSGFQRKLSVKTVAYKASNGQLIEDAQFKILYKNKWQPLEEVPVETLESGTVWKIRAEAEGYKSEEFSLLIDWYQDALMISSELEKEE